MQRRILRDSILMELFMKKQVVSITVAVISTTFWRCRWAKAQITPELGGVRVSRPSLRWIFSRSFAIVVGAWVCGCVRG